MRHKHVAVLILIIAIAAAAYLFWPRASSDTSRPTLAPTTSISEQHGRYLFNITLHTPEEIAGLLARAEQLAQTTRTDDAHTGIALVLHGPEIEMFAKQNYPRFRQTVDQAARLDAAHVIEVKMCLTEMRRLGLRKEDIPDFIELVPYGPDEEERLRRNGYVYL
jgi:hypothetical protein